MTQVLTIILGGGKGTRLYPLTKNRAKPAVPFGAKYRLVDIPISNSINAGFKKIYVLTQFNSASLHLHLANTYIFDSFTRGFVEILAAEQTFDHASWYEGTADAVRKNIHHFKTQKPSHYLILSGDQLYRMNMADFFEKHVQSNADITIAATPVDREAAEGFGIMKADKKGRVTSFLEKPELGLDINEMKIPESIHPDEEMKRFGREYLGSMGIYFFKAEALEEALESNFTDFGKEIIPQMIKNKRVQAYIETGFWEDIGTIKNFYETNLNLASINPKFNFYDERMPIYTHKRDLPASKFNYCSISQTLTGDGCVITNASIQNSVIGIRTFIESGSSLDGVVCMGADWYETPADRMENKEKRIPDIGIGRGTLVKRAIIDKNARIGEGCRIGVDSITREDGDHGMYYMQDGIIIIPKNAVIPPGTVI
ncbi:glucose-1-phosphate adenylyltransferase [Spirochaeta lutea]|uniref:Glucose-1-phosphate adenylyltransferase n=1 Tax=Spirochaeta lutea TaxID=1480694 RepID=A0A098R1J8_9SPIO|nr:glucose-1-phosphate adenylyltransferase [Spirochaeta lutea]KGE73558.1 glucose-1-phosphate adenylyltransferase [Spirochaeta lutea]